MSIIRRTTVGLLFAALFLLPTAASSARADDDDWEDAQEEWQEELDERWEDAQEAREEQRERWEEWREDQEDRAEHQLRFRPGWSGNGWPRYGRWSDGDYRAYYFQDYGHYPSYRYRAYRDPGYVDRYYYGDPHCYGYYGLPRIGVYDFGYGYGGAVRVGPVLVDWD